MVCGETVLLAHSGETKSKPYAAHTHCNSNFFQKNQKRCCTHSTTTATKNRECFQTVCQASPSDEITRHKIPAQVPNATTKKKTQPLYMNNTGRHIYQKTATTPWKYARGDTQHPPSPTPFFVVSIPGTCHTIRSDGHILKQRYSSAFVGVVGDDRNSLSVSSETTQTLRWHQSNRPIKSTVSKSTGVFSLSTIISYFQVGCQETIATYWDRSFPTAGRSACLFGRARRLTASYKKKKRTSLPYQRLRSRDH